MFVFVIQSRIKPCRFAENTDGSTDASTMTRPLPGSGVSVSFEAAGSLFSLLKVASSRLAEAEALSEDPGETAAPKAKKTKRMKAREKRDRFRLRRRKP
jgi:hypothetical protein